VVILIGGLKSDTGKSTIAVHLAAWLDEQRKQVAFVDADTEQGNGAAWIGVASPGVSVYMVGDAETSLRRVTQIVAEHCVIDGPSDNPDFTRSLMGLADAVVMPTGPWQADRSALRQTVHTLGQVQQARQGKPVGLIVLNHLLGRTRLATGALFAAKELEVPVARTSLGLRTAYANARWQGSVVWRMAGDASAAAEEMHALLAEALPDEGPQPTAPRFAEIPPTKWDLTQQPESLPYAARA